MTCSIYRKFSFLQKRMEMIRGTQLSLMDLTTQDKLSLQIMKKAESKILACRGYLKQQNLKKGKRIIKKKKGIIKRVKDKKLIPTKNKTKKLGKVLMVVSAKEIKKLVVIKKVEMRINQMMNRIIKMKI